MVYEVVKQRLIDCKAEMIYVTKLKLYNIKAKIGETYKLITSVDEKQKDMVEKLSKDLNIPFVFDIRPLYRGSWDRVIKRNIPYLVALVRNAYKDLKWEYINSVVQELVWYFMHYYRDSFEPSRIWKKKTYKMPSMDCFFTYSCVQGLQAAYLRALDVNTKDRVEAFNDYNEKIYLEKGHYINKGDMVDPIDRLDYNDILTCNEKGFERIEEKLWLEKFVEFIYNTNNEEIEGENDILAGFAQNPEQKIHKRLIEKIKTLYIRFQYGV
jgi:hypothetical protein